MVRIFAILSVLSGAGLVAATFVIDGRQWIFMPLAVFYTLWLIAFFRRWGWVQDAGFFLVIGMIALGLLMGHSAILLFTGAFLSLVGWDLAAFSMRLEAIKLEADKILLLRHHFIRLGLCIAIGMGLIYLVLNIQFKIAFGWMVLFSLLAALGLGRLIYRLLK
jgi:hypothetical protein